MNRPVELTPKPSASPRTKLVIERWGPVFAHRMTTALGTDQYFEAPVPDGCTMPGWQGWLPSDEIWCAERAIDDSHCGECMHARNHRIAPCYERESE